MPQVKTEKRSFVIEINQAWCKGCYLCLEACPIEGIFVIEDEVSERGFRPVAVMHPEKCTGCNLCELLCPDLAIVVRIKNSEL